ncbi:serine hydrolase domain-containing protein [Gemmatimonas groenlandica]|uniref:Beta-lactamase family protein n=1 Tax=Gemmatimonas groenlandica TaxID=2732249 RepID=A0A6M4INK0_9BACT|nr:serine hydrolase domain-containing protein [Gemmatimonas groenlandica]QJR35498.1 beta-lactamase family protein [Gemmatimonas groenlandica]
MLTSRSRSRVLVATALLATTVRLGHAQSTPSTPPSWAARLDSVARAALATSKAPGATVAVVVDGKLAYAQGYGLANVETQQRMTADMLLRVGSVTKMFTGTMLATLAEQQRIDMSVPIGDIVPSLKGKKVGAVTTQQLMTHSAGWLDNAVAYGRMGEGALGEVMREVGDTLFYTEPGHTFSYSNPSISMAGYVGEVAGKQRFAALVESLVLRPAGMKLSTFKPLEALTYPIAMGHQAGTGGMQIVRPMTENTAQWAAGFLFATAPELARYTIALMNGGTIDGAEAFSAGAVRRVTTGYVAHPGGSGLDSAMYGYGLVVGRSGKDRVWTHGGAINGYNASLTMLPDRKAAVIVLVNGPGSGIDAIESAALQLAVGYSQPKVAAPVARDANAAERAALVGRYAQGRNVLEVLEQDGALKVKQGLSVMSAKLVGANELLVTPPQGAALHLYVRSENGKAAYLYAGSRAFARQ